MTRGDFYKRLLLNIISYGIPFVVILTVWLPVINHYHVQDIVINNEMIEASRSVPTDSIFDELNRFSFGLELSPNDENQAVVIAERILGGQVEIPGLPSIAIGMPFASDDLDKKAPNWPGWRLFFAGFALPDVLLRAYEVTRRDEFLMAAKDMILAFAEYEGKAWLPKGLLWNDHAIAERISVLAEFWKLYRNHSNYEAEVAKAIFQLVARSAQLLAKPSHFTFSSNHGIMQNLALWQICLAFPMILDVEFYKQLALERMRDQMTYYVNDEGVVLEHSAGYQLGGLRFIGMAFRYLKLMNISIPKEWRVKYQRALDFYAQLRRPDGSLPMFGDTGAGTHNPCPTVMKIDSDVNYQTINYPRNCIPTRSDSLYPVAGYSIWWDGLDEWPNQESLNQTVVAWSYFPGHAHKHADEMSVLLWANGITWCTNIGYWPYGTKGRSEATSWSGSNAPHLVGEIKHSLRNTKLKFHGWSKHLAMIDLERRGPNEYVARRQVLQIKPNLWIVIDHASGNENDRTTITWTTSHNILLRQGKIPGSFILEKDNNSPSLTQFILGSEDTKIMQFRGNFSPFAGWEDKRPASSIVIEQPANNSWAVSIWSMQNGIVPNLQFKGPPFMEEWKSPEKWKLVLPLIYSQMNICRHHNRVFVNEDVNGGVDPKKLILSEASQQGHSLVEIRIGYENTARKYPRKRYLMDRLSRATYFLFLIFLLQEAFFIAYGKLYGKYSAGLRLLSSFCWLVIGIGLVTVYL